MLERENISRRSVVNGGRYKTLADVAVEMQHEKTCGGGGNEIEGGVDKVGVDRAFCGVAVGVILWETGCICLTICM